MSERSYTPGPWELREVAHDKTPFGPRRVYRVEIIAPQYLYGRRTHSRDIAQMVDYCEWTDHPANARLICAAPELYEALKAWMRFAEECEQRNVIIPLWAALLNEKAVNLTLAAIAKAEGR